MKIILLSLFVFLCTRGLVFCQNDTLEIYTLKGCERCRQTVKFAMEKKLPFRIYQNEIKEDHIRLGKVLDKVGFFKGELSFPVVGYLGKTYYNIPDLDNFLKSLLLDQ
jgi:glutaredoxin